MGNSIKKSNPVARQQVARELTPEQKQEAMVRFFTQKRESFATGVLFNMMQNPALLERSGFMESGYLNTSKVATVAVDIADKMIEKLYPLKEESETVETK